MAANEFLYGRNAVTEALRARRRALRRLLVAKGGFAIDCDHGGGHEGPPAPLRAASWEFLQMHPFGANPEPYASGLPASFPSYCQIIK